MHFKRFPLEIREMIWGLAACEPRVIKVAFIAKYAYDWQPVSSVEEDIYLHSDYTLKSGSFAPAILQACEESKAVGEKYYERPRGGGHVLHQLRERHHLV